MKKVKSILVIAVLLFLVTNSNAQEQRYIRMYQKNGIFTQIPVSEIDSMKFVPFDEENEWVVINGVKWATRNVNTPGTFAAKPEDAGMFYQWNRSIGWSSTDPMINSNGGTTWDSSISDGESWVKANDPCPTGWRVPTYEEQESLLNSGSVWGKLNGVYGRFFGNDSQRLFFPTVGCRFSSEGWLINVGGYGYYWSATANYSELVYSMYFSSEYTYPSTYPRNNGFSVRCVVE